MVQVSEVAAGDLDPTWLGRSFEVVEESPDGPVTHGLRLVSYRKLAGRDTVVLVGENTSVAVGREVRLKCFTEPAVPGRWTGAPPDLVAPGASPMPPGAGPSGYPPAGGYPAGPAGPGPGGGAGPAGGGPAAPWLRRPAGS